MSCSGRSSTCTSLPTNEESSSGHLPTFEEGFSTTYSAVHQDFSDEDLIREQMLADWPEATTSTPSSAASVPSSGASSRAFCSLM